MRKKQKGHCYVRKFRPFLFGMGPDVPPFKVCIPQSDFKFWIGVKWILVITVTGQWQCSHCWQQHGDWAANGSVVYIDSACFLTVSSLHMRTYHLINLRKVWVLQFEPVYCYAIQCRIVQHNLWTSKIKTRSNNKCDFTELNITNVILLNWKIRSQSF